MIDGVLQIGDETFHVVHSAHAEDLPEGEAGRTEIAERIRQHYANIHNVDRLQAHWLKLSVDEIPAKFMRFGKLPF